MQVVYNHRNQAQNKACPAGTKIPPTKVDIERP